MFFHSVPCSMRCVRMLRKPFLVGYWGLSPCGPPLWTPDVGLVRCRSHKHQPVNVKIKPFNRIHSVKSIPLPRSNRDRKGVWSKPQASWGASPLDGGHCASSLRSSCPWRLPTPRRLLSGDPPDMRGLRQTHAAWQKQETMSREIVSD